MITRAAYNILVHYVAGDDLVKMSPWEVLSLYRKMFKEDPK